VTDLWWSLAWVGGAFVAALAAAVALRRIGLAALQRWKERPELLRAGADAVRGPSLWWCLVLGLYAANEVAEGFDLLPKRWHGGLRMTLEMAAILSITVTLAGFAGRLTARAAEERALGGAVTGLAQTATRVVVIVVGLLVLLSTAGIRIAPILTALGVGGLAVALALQDSLANLFAGIHLLADRPVQVGDYVKVADAAEGFVVDIGWRSTRIRSLANNVIVVPNETMGKATITNFSQPEPRTALGFTVSVDFSVDADRVEAVLQEELNRTVGQVKGLLPDPSVSLIPGFGEHSLDFSVGYQVATFVDQYQVQHELRKRILRRFHKEGITIPAPVPVRAS
jgi:small-conductance mechanosensitive channel